jgi:hypothetical protein
MYSQPEMHESHGRGDIGASGYLDILFNQTMKKAKGIADAVVTPVKRPVVVAQSSTPFLC